MHDPKYDEWEVLLTAGNTDGTDGILRACLDRGDYLLVEEFGTSPPFSGGCDGMGLDTARHASGGRPACTQSTGIEARVPCTDAQPTPACCPPPKPSASEPSVSPSTLPA